MRGKGMECGGVDDIVSIHLSKAAHAGKFYQKLTTWMMAGVRIFFESVR